MKPTPPKRRVLTAREKEMRRRYTRIVKFDGPLNLYGVFLSVGDQSFGISNGFPDQACALWTRDMLAIALSKIEL